MVTDRVLFIGINVFRCLEVSALPIYVHLRSGVIVRAGKVVILFSVIILFTLIF